jgi:hypothetical protein
MGKVRTWESFVPESHLILGMFFTGTKLILTCMSVFSGTFWNGSIIFPFWQERMGTFWLQLSSKMFGTVWNELLKIITQPSGATNFK